MGRQLAFPKTREEVDEVFNDARMKTCYKAGEYTHTNCIKPGQTEKPFDGRLHVNMFLKYDRSHDSQPAGWGADNKMTKFHLSSYGYAASPEIWSADTQITKQCTMI